MSNREFYENGKDLNLLPKGSFGYQNRASINLNKSHSYRQGGGNYNNNHCSTKDENYKYHKNHSYAQNNSRGYENNNSQFKQTTRVENNFRNNGMNDQNVENFSTPKSSRGNYRNRNFNYNANDDKANITNSQKRKRYDDRDSVDEPLAPSQKRSKDSRHIPTEDEEASSSISYQLSTKRDFRKIKITKMGNKSNYDVNDNDQDEDYMTKGKKAARSVLSADLNFDMNKIQELETVDEFGNDHIDSAACRDFLGEIQDRVHANRDALKIMKKLDDEVKLEKSRRITAVENEQIAIKKQEAAEAREAAFKEEMEKYRLQAYAAEKKCESLKKQIDIQSPWRKLALSCVGNIRALGKISEELIKEYEEDAKAPEYFKSDIALYKNSIYLIKDKRVPLKMLTDHAVKPTSQINMLGSHDRKHSYRFRKGEDGPENYVWLKTIAKNEKKDGLLGEIDLDK